MRSLLLAFVVVPLALVVAGAADPPAKLAEQLGDRDYHTREAAGKQLDALGEAALPALKQVAAAGSPEAARRARALVRRITGRVESEKILAPKLITLDLRDADFKTVADAIMKQTGYKLAIDGIPNHTKVDRAALAKTKLTIRLTNRPFWEAVAEVEKQLGMEVDWWLPEEGALLLCDPLEMRPAPTSNAHSVRIEAARFRMDLDQLSTEVIPLIFSARPEPGLEWVRTNEVVVTKAVTADGTTLRLDEESAQRTWEVQLRTPTRTEFGRRPLWAVQASGIAARPDPVLGYYLPEKENSVLFHAPPGKPLAKLASVEGVLRGQVARTISSGPLAAAVEVEVPFQFTNLPVTPGTRDPKAEAKEVVLKPTRVRILGGIGP